MNKPLTFSPLKIEGLLHAFTLRQEPSFEVEKFSDLGFPKNSFVLAEQIHSNEVALVDSAHCGQTIARADALIANQSDVTLVIRTADCAPVFIFDSVTHAIGLVHSGKKGTQLDIFTSAVEKMKSAFGTQPENLIVVLGPCIRPPLYEIDIPSEIASQAKRAGIRAFHDCGFNTGDDLNRFYSYRVEKGKTARHFSALSRTTVLDL